MPSLHFARTRRQEYLALSIRLAVELGTDGKKDTWSRADRRYLLGLLALARGDKITAEDYFNMTLAVAPTYHPGTRMFSSGNPDSGRDFLGPDKLAFRNCHPGFDYAGAQALYFEVKQTRKQ
jgi:hypothetical protein